MNKYVLVLRTGSEFVAYREEYACFEANSKEDLLLEINLALLEYDVNKNKIEEGCSQLRLKEEKLRKGSHKKEPNIMAALEISKEINNKMNSIKYISIQNRKFDLDYFYYKSSEGSYSQRKLILDEVKIHNLLTLEEWFDKNKGDFIS